MKLFVKHEIFKRLNVGFQLDEGIASETDVYKVFNAERSPMSKCNTYDTHFYCIK
jgi:aminoacylase